MSYPRKPSDKAYGRSRYPRPSSGSYGYGGYGGSGAYGYGYPGGASGTTTVQQTFQDYMLILRERIWYIVVAFIVVFAGTAIYTYSRQPIYQSETTVQIFREEPKVMTVQQVMNSDINSAEDLNTQISILESNTMIQRVAARLTGDDLQRFLAPYIKPGQPAPRAEGILAANRHVILQRASLILIIQYQHPNRDVAAKVANLFADEYIAYNAHILSDESLTAVRELEQRADDQRKKVDQIANALQAYREKNNLVSLDARKDIVTEKLKELNTYVAQSSNTLQDAETRWKQVTLSKQKGDDLLDLPFIANVPLVAQLQQQVAGLKITVAQLSQRYRPKHPQMQAANRALTEAETELGNAIATTTDQVEAAYQTALQDYARARAALATQETDSLSLDRFGVEYSNMEREYDVNEKLLEQILERMRATSVSGTIESQNARIIDRGTPSRRPVSPNYRLNLGLGGIGGAVLGLTLAFFVAYTDDRVKSAFDIESVVGLPLVGILPEVKRLGRVEDMSKAVAGKSHREVTEAFTTLLSSLKLKEETKNAQCILVTSTVASEGKTFIATNLAETYAAHGDRVLVIDCDLRRPSVNRVFHLENLKGVIDVCTAGVGIDDAIVKEVKKNLDVLPTGGRSKNPALVLSSKEFAVMLSEMRKRYDRIFIDTPPVAIVSDALIVIPMIDGWLYSIYFNKVKRKTVEYCVKRLLDVNVPNLGAVLNGLTGGVGGYYYSHYYDKSYKKYYVTHDEQANGEGSKIAEAPPTKRRR